MGWTGENTAKVARTGSEPLPQALAYKREEDRNEAVCPCKGSTYCLAQVVE